MSQGKLKIRNIYLMAFVFALAGCGAYLPDYIKSGKNKYENNDFRGALNDYTEGIELWIKAPIGKDPRHVSTLYAKRADLKCHRLNDTQGALDDYSRSISVAEEFRQFLVKIDPGAINDYALARVYESRAICKEKVLKDTDGAREDLSVERTYSNSASDKASRDEAAREERARKAQGPSIWELNSAAAGRDLEAMRARDNARRDAGYRRDNNCSAGDTRSACR